MTQGALLTLPIGIPWVLATVLALLDGRKKWVGLLAAAGLGTSLLSLVWLALAVLWGGPIAMTAGGWPEGVGITLRADALSVTFALVSVGVILVSLLFELSLGVRWRTFPALVLLVATGLTGLFLTGDAFNFYVFFEISMTASFILAGYREEDYQVRAAFIFAIVNLLGSVMFLIGIAALYSVTGSLNMEVIAERMSSLEPRSVITTAALIFAAFLLKLGLFPFHFWLPAVYVGSHPPVAAILSGALANIGAYGLLRFGGGILPRELEFGSAAVVVIGAASLIYGSLQAVSRRNASEVLAYSAIGQAGYIILALGVGGPVGYVAAVLYAVVNSLNKALLFLAVGLRGPAVGAAFAVGAFSVVGVPPAAGFLGKVAVFKAGAAVDVLPTSVALIALVFLGSALSFVYSFQVYQRRFMARTKQEGNDPGKPSPAAARSIVVALAALVLVIGLWPEPLLILSEAAAAALSFEGSR
ncbi:MAG: oxidoreductase [Actinomycetota bacterium]|nr:oxidoreductase [Actinomycetota bacterium]